LCGQNIPRKTYILESIRRYFSTYKYSEEQNKWRNNVKIDNELVGRKFFTVLSVNEAAELLTWIKWSKQSLMVEYVKGLMQKFDWQLHLRTIDEELEEMFQLINKDLSHLGDVELTYAVSDVWDMVQKSNVVGNGQTSLEDKNNFELFAPWLSKIVSLKRTEAKYIGYDKKKGSPYDVLLDTYEPGVYTEEASMILNDLKDFLIPFLKKIQDSQKTNPALSSIADNRNSRLSQIKDIPITRQFEFNTQISKSLGFDKAKNKCKIDCVFSL
jgi:Zn-dependent M32 family carboxypeptidase